MKKILICATIGIAAIYIIKKLSKSNSVENILDDAAIFKIKAKKKLRNAIYDFQNDKEYLGKQIQELKRKASLNIQNK